MKEYERKGGFSNLPTDFFSGIVKKILVKFASEVIGTDVDHEQIDRMRRTLERMRRVFWGLPIEEFVKYLPLMSRVEGGLPRKVRKVIFISSKILISFPFYCDERNFDLISYPGPTIGRRKDVERYDDPKIPVFYPKEDEISADVCVVGSGAGGSISAMILSERYSVCVIERGKLVLPSDFTEKEEDMVPKLYGVAIDSSLSILTAYGNCVGGSTVCNTAFFERLPQSIYERWCEVGFPVKKERFYELQDKLFSMANVSEVDFFNNANKKIKLGMEKAGVRYSLLNHSRRDCIRAGFCELGCYWNRKFSALLNVLPEVGKRGGFVVPETEAVYLERSNGAVKRLICNHRGKRMKIKAKSYILAGGALFSPLILGRSKIASPDGLSLHPSTYVMGIFDEDISSWFGIPKSIISTDFLKEEGGFILLPYNLHPAMFSVALGGKGKEHFELMRKYKNIAGVAVMVHDKPYGNSLRDRSFLNILYSFSKDEVEDMKKGISVAASILFEGGAKELIMPSIFRIVKAKSMRDVQSFVDNLDLYSVPILSVHPQATLRWPKFLEDDGRVKGMKNLYVADASVFPEATGVPPQATVMTISMYVASNVAQNM